MAKRLRTKPPRGDYRVFSQLDAIRSITQGTNLGLRCFLARYRNENEYGERASSDLEDFEFTVKGLIRLEMMSLDDDDYLHWRRLFGTTTGEKAGRHAPKFVGKPASWKSRVLLTALTDGAEAREYLTRSPLNSWPGDGLMPLAEALSGDEEGPLVLMQVHDVDLIGEDGDDIGETFADLFSRYLDDSELWEKIGECRCLTDLGEESDE